MPFLQRRYGSMREEAEPPTGASVYDLIYGREEE